MVRRSLWIAMAVVTAAALADVGVIQVQHARARAESHREAAYNAALQASMVEDRKAADEALEAVTLPSSFRPVTADMNPSCETSTEELCRFSPAGPRATMTALLTAMRAAGLSPSQASCTLVIAGGTSGAAPMQTKRVPAPCIGNVPLGSTSYLNVYAFPRWIDDTSSHHPGPRFRGTVITVSGEDHNFP